MPVRYATHSQKKPTDLPRGDNTRARSWGQEILAITQLAAGRILTEEQRAPDRDRGPEVASLRLLRGGGPLDSCDRSRSPASVQHPPTFPRFTSLLVASRPIRASLSVHDRHCFVIVSASRATWTKTNRRVGAMTVSPTPARTGPHKAPPAFTREACVLREPRVAMRWAVPFQHKAEPRWHTSEQ